jgi:glycosyltransferase involved in cell wall biosynthesis
MAPDVEEFFQRHDGVIFSYVCFRKEFALEFLAGAIRRFRESHPKVGFLWVGPWSREMEPMEMFLRSQKIEGAVLLQGSVPHEMFLNMLTRSLAYIRTPVTDGVCSSVLESLKLKVPVLAADNRARPLGTELWNEGDTESLLTLMNEVVEHHEQMVARIPEITVDDNAKRLADSIEDVCRDFPGFAAPDPSVGTVAVNTRVTLRRRDHLSPTGAVEEKIDS